MSLRPNPGTSPRARLPDSVACLPLEADQPLLPGLATNCFLIFTSRGTLVVDPPSARPAALDAIQAAARGAIVAILVTHTHPDHIGGVAALAQRTGAGIFAHPRALPFLPGGFLFQPLPHGAELEGWQVLHTPGHREDSLTFFSPESGCAIVGDLVAGFGTVVIDPPDGDLLDYLGSLRFLRDEVRPALLAPGHGPLVDDPPLLLSYFIEHRLARERRVLAALSDRAAPLDVLLPVVYADTSPSLYPLAARSLLAHLLKLKREGRAREEADGWALSAGGA